MKKNLRYILIPSLNSPDLEEVLTNSPKLQSAEWSITYNPTQSEPLFAGLHTNLPSLEVSANLPIADAQLVYDLLYHLDKEDGWDNIKATTDASYIVLEYLGSKRADELVNVLSIPAKRLPDRSLESALTFDASSVIPLMSPGAHSSTANLVEKILIAEQARVVEQRTTAVSTAFKVLPPRSFSLSTESEAEYRAQFNPADKTSSVSAEIDVLEAESALLRERITSLSAPFKRYELNHKDSGDFFRPLHVSLEDSFFPELLKGSDVQEQVINTLLFEPIIALGHSGLFDAVSTESTDARKRLEKTAKFGLKEFTITYSDDFINELEKPFHTNLVNTSIKDLIFADTAQILSNNVSLISELEPLSWDLTKTENIVSQTTHKNEVKKPVLDYKVGSKIGDLIAGGNPQLLFEKAFTQAIAPKKHHLRFNVTSYAWPLDNTNRINTNFRKLNAAHPFFDYVTWTNERYEEHTILGSGDEGPFFQEGTNAGVFPPQYYWYVATPSFQGTWREQPWSQTGFRDPMSGGRRVNTHIREMTAEDIANQITSTPGDIPPHSPIATGKTYVEKLLAGDYGEAYKKIALSWGQFDIGLQPSLASNVNLGQKIFMNRSPTMDPAIQRSLMTISFIDRPYALANDLITDVAFKANLGFRDIASTVASNSNHHNDGISIFSKQWRHNMPYARGIFDVKPPIVTKASILATQKATTKSEREPLFFHKRAQQQPPTILGYDEVNLKIKAYSEREADGGDPFMRFVLYATINVPEQAATTKSENVTAAKTAPFLINEASFIDFGIDFKYAPKGMKTMEIEVDDFFTRKGDFQRDLPENNVQASSGPGSAFIPRYCPGYFLEAYVGEPGSHASF